MSNVPATLSVTETPSAPRQNAVGDAPRADLRRLLLLGLLAAGAALRLFQYVANRSLWLDESLIVSSILDRSFGGLLEPLDYGQTAPAGFLFLVKLATLWFGTGEFALRLVPLLAGLGALALFVPVARRFVSRNAVVLAMALFALAPYLIYYASEVKQYSLDVLVSLVVLALAHDAGEAPALDRRRAVVLGAVGVVAPWLSQPSIFMLAGAGLVLGIRALRSADWARVRVLVPVGAAWVVSFAGAYAASRRGLADEAYMEAFWETGFPTLSPSTLDEWLWFPLKLARVFREPLGAMGEDASGMHLPQVLAGLVAFLAGCVWAARSRDWRLALLLVPLLLVVAASTLRLYPFGADWLTSGRVLIFLIPTFVLLMAEGAERVRLRWRRVGAAAAAVLVVLMLIPSVTYAVVRVPQPRTEIKSLLDYAASHRQPGDVLYVYYNGRSSFEYYAPRYGWDRSNTIFGICARLEPRRYADDLAKLRGRPRVWVLFVDGFGADGYPEKQLMLGYLDHQGKQLDDRVAHGASLYLFDLNTTPTKTGVWKANPPTFPKSMVDMDCRGPWAPEPYAAARG